MLYSVGLLWMTSGTTLKVEEYVPMAYADVVVFATRDTDPIGPASTVEQMFGAVTVMLLAPAGKTADACCPLENAVTRGTVPLAQTPTVGATAAWATVTRALPPVADTSLRSTVS